MTRAPPPLGTRETQKPTETRGPGQRAFRTRGADTRSGPGFPLLPTGSVWGALWGKHHPVFSDGVAFLLTVTNLQT